MKSAFSTKMTITNITDNFFGRFFFFFLIFRRFHYVRVLFLLSLFSLILWAFTLLLDANICFGKGFFVCVCSLIFFSSLFVLSYCCHFIISGEFLQGLRMHAGRVASSFLINPKVFSLSIQALQFHLSRHFCYLTWFWHEIFLGNKVSSTIMNYSAN